jgi:hypothetical protein
MTATAAPVLAACALLVLAGIGKVRRPATTVGAVKSVGFRVSATAVRLLGLGELVVGGTAVAVGGPVLTALVGLGYLGFTGFLVLALRRGGALSSCGCLGRPDTPPTVTHAAVTAALGLTALGSAATGGLHPADWALAPTDVVLAAFTALATWLAWLVFAVLPHARFPRAKEH